jgi:hypothetical protein
MIRDLIGLQEPIMKHISTVLVNTRYAPDVQMGYQLAASLNGLLEGFQGKALQDTAAIGTNLYNGLAHNKSYVITNTNQVLMLATRNTAASIDANTGIVQADGSAKRGGLLLKTTLIDACGLVLAQDDALWLHSKSNFEVAFGIEALSGEAMTAGKIQLGVAGELAATAAQIGVAPSANGYFAIEISNNQMRIVGSDGTTAVASPWVKIPTLPNVLKLRYFANNSRREAELLINHQPVTHVRLPDNWNTGLQVCCRVGTTGAVATAMGVELAGVMATLPNIGD